MTNLESRPHSGEPDATREVTLGQRIAGAMLIANGVLLALEVGVMSSTSSSIDSTGLRSPSATSTAALVDIIIGVSLLAKSRRWVRWAVIRAVLGLVVYTAILGFENPFAALMQLGVSSALLLMLIGDAGKRRLAIGGAVFGLYAFLGVLGIRATLTGTMPFAGFVGMVSGDIESTPAGIIIGGASHYRLHAPSDKWHLRKPSAAKKDNPLADRWLTQPGANAHVLVIAEIVPGELVAVDTLANAVVYNASRTSSKFELIDRARLKSHPKEGLMIHTRSTTGGVDIESLIGIVATYERGYQIIAFAPRNGFANVEADLRSIIESFELPTDEKFGVPADVEPNEVSHVEGRAQKYEITAPGTGWYLRKDEFARKNNKLVDRWLVRPDKGAHIVIMAEQVPGAAIDIEKYADTIAKGIQTKLGATISSREHSRSAPKTSIVIGAKATVNGLQMEYLYGLFAEGDHAFQVVAGASEDTFDELKSDFLKVIETFKMPARTVSASTPKR